jgi:hypothetical protein
MIVQQALAAKNMNDVCDNKYIRMAYTAGNLNPQIQQALNLLGCNGPNRKYGSSTIPGDTFSSLPNDKFATGRANRLSTTTIIPDVSENENDEEGEGWNNQNTNSNDDDNLESVLTPEKESKVQQLLSIARGEKGAKRNFLKSLFGLNKKTKTFKSGQKLPSSKYKLDKDDANSLKDLEKELEQYDKTIQ